MFFHFKIKYLSRHRDLMQIGITPSGVLIVACRGTSTVYAIQRGDAYGLIGKYNSVGPHRLPSLRLDPFDPYGLVVSNADRCVYVSDTHSHVVLRVPLPRQFFKNPPRSCAVCPYPIRFAVAAGDLRAVVCA